MLPQEYICKPCFFIENSTIFFAFVTFSRGPLVFPYKRVIIQVNLKKKSENISCSFQFCELLLDWAFQLYRTIKKRPCSTQINLCTAGRFLFSFQQLHHAAHHGGLFLVQLGDIQKAPGLAAEGSPDRHGDRAW